MFNIHSSLTGLRSQSCWLLQNKPSWWPDLPFRSPNSGPNRIKCAEMDLVLQACMDHFQERQPTNRETSAEWSTERAAERTAERAAEGDLEPIEQSFVISGRSQIAEQSIRYSEIKKTVEVSLLELFTC